MAVGGEVASGGGEGSGAEDVVDERGDVGHVELSVGIHITDDEAVALLLNVVERTGYISAVFVNLREHHHLVGEAVGER